MSTLSRLAPVNPSGPGTSLDNPFRTTSIMHTYNLMDRLHFRVAAGSCKVRYDRIGSRTRPGLPHPVDHYVLFEGDMDSTLPEATQL